MTHLRRTTRTPIVSESSAIVDRHRQHTDVRKSGGGTSERVSSAAAGAKLDTGNALAAVEDPVDAARALAPFVFATHVRDVRVEAAPWGRKAEVPETVLIPGGLLVMLEVGLGEGHVDFGAVLAILADAPHWSELVLTIEEGPTVIDASVAYAREHFVPYFQAPAHARSHAPARHTLPASHV